MNKPMLKVEDSVFYGITEQIEYAHRNNDSKTANHFFRLLRRLQTGQKLTKKMQENLGAVKLIAAHRKELWDKFGPENKEVVNG
jgi:hypothetical protein